MAVNSFWGNKNVLITGHTGFKGSWLALWLSEMGANVYGYALEPDTNPSIFDQLKLKNKINYLEIIIKIIDQNINNKLKIE